jgi:hypothetical protein
VFLQCENINGLAGGATPCPFVHGEEHPDMYALSYIRGGHTLLWGSLIRSADSVGRSAMCLPYYEDLTHITISHNFLTDKKKTKIK